MKTNIKFYFKIITTWLFVGIPLIWGVVQTIIKSLALFK